MRALDREPRFDLAWFIGGAATGYGMLALHAVFGLDMITVWFAWFVLLDSPHFFATWSRTYLDREEWRGRGACSSSACGGFSCRRSCCCFRSRSTDSGCPVQSGAGRALGGRESLGVLARDSTALWVHGALSAPQ